jgi:hypothetical protein
MARGHCYSLPKHEHRTQQSQRCCAAGCQGPGRRGGGGGGGGNGRINVSCGLQLVLHPSLCCSVFSPAANDLILLTEGLVVMPDQELHLQHLQWYVTASGG